MSPGTKRTESLAKTRLFLVSTPRHINSIFAVNTPILYLNTCNVDKVNNTKTD